MGLQDWIDFFNKMNKGFAIFVMTFVKRLI